MGEIPYWHCVLPFMGKCPSSDWQSNDERRWFRNFSAYQAGNPGVVVQQSYVLHGHSRAHRLLNGSEQTSRKWSNGLYILRKPINREAAYKYWTPEVQWLWLHKFKQVDMKQKRLKRRSRSSVTFDTSAEEHTCLCLFASRDWALIALLNNHSRDN